MYSVVEAEAALEDLRETVAYLNYRTGGNRARGPICWARVRPYIVLYTVNEADEMVVIERVEHKSRNWRALLG